MNPRERYDKYSDYVQARAKAVLEGSKPPEVPKELSCGKTEVLVNNDGVAVVNIRGEIGWDVIPNWVVGEIDKIKADEIVVNINSGGGSLYGGRAIANALRKHPANVRTVNESLAASIAAVIFLSGDERVMMEGSMLMLHRSHGAMILSGNEEEFVNGIKSAEKMREVMQSADKNLAETVANVSGMTQAEAMDVLRAETWYTEQEAIEAKLATGGDPVRKTAKAGKKKKNVKAEIKEPVEPLKAQMDIPESTPKEEIVEELDLDIFDEYLPLDRLHYDPLAHLGEDVLAGVEYSPSAQG